MTAVAPADKVGQVLPSPHRLHVEPHRRCECGCAARQERNEAALTRIESMLEALLDRLGAAAAPAPSCTTAPDWLTAAQAAHHVGLSVKALYADVSRGGCFATAASRAGRRLRFNRQGLDRLLQKRGRARDLIPRVSSPGGSG